METIKKPLLVPWDFTEVADSALQHAVILARVAKTEIVLLNVVKKEKEISEITEKLNAVAVDFVNKYELKVTAIVKEGNIFSTISDTAEEIGASLVIMGTHGINGMQKLTGSWALKVITGSKVPFVVVQAVPAHCNYKNVVFPLDFKVESKQKLVWARYLAVHFNLKMQVLIPNSTSDDVLKKTRANLAFTKKYFEEKEIEYEIHIAEKGNFIDKTIEFAKKTDADMIIIMTTKDPGFTDFVFAANEQQVIANEAKIPVMCVNPRTDLNKQGGFN